MTKEEIKEGNKLIAEFMGAVVIETYYKMKEDTREEKVLDHHLMDMSKVPGQNEKYVATTCMKYNTSWDWLISVLQEIYKRKRVDTYVHMGYVGSDIRRSLLSLKIKDTFEAIVAFIKWYNGRDRQPG